eukprot:1853165-Amphidinium_carterae.1
MVLHRNSNVAVVTHNHRTQHMTCALMNIVLEIPVSCDSDPDGSASRNRCNPRCNKALTKNYYGQLL